MLDTTGHPQQAADQREWERAAVLTGAADSTWRSIPAVPPQPLAAHRSACADAVREALGEQRWSAGVRRGAALDRAQAVAAALGEAPDKAAERIPPSGQGETPKPTKRQHEVAALVAQGLTDREIAARLVISPRTAESHVEQILARLGFRSRAEIAAWTASRGGAGPERSRR